MDSRLADRFGRNLWLCRRRSGISQETLAMLAELHRAEIPLFERGKRLPRLDTLLKLSAGVEASSCELLAGLQWHPGCLVPGVFHVEDASEWVKPAEGDRP